MLVIKVSGLYAASPAPNDFFHQFTFLPWLSATVFSAVSISDFFTKGLGKFAALSLASFFYGRPVGKSSAATFCRIHFHATA